MPAKKNAKIYFQKIASILKLDFLVFKITRRIPSLGSSEVIEQKNSMDLQVLLTIFLDLPILDTPKLIYLSESFG